VSTPITLLVPDVLFVKAWTLRLPPCQSSTQTLDANFLNVVGRMCGRRHLTRYAELVNFLIRVTTVTHFGSTEIESGGVQRLRSERLRRPM